MKYTKFSETSNGLHQYSATSYTTETTTDRSREAGISLEQIGGIRRVVDVKVSV